ncbi:MAG TPA: rRNA pseudouridine synthase, partial [Acidobacteriota bacterium]|nr:rRNA pseudouridine synthase [Acidobacteriota bacterium]
PCQIVLHREADNAWYRVTLFQGLNRQIRKMFARYGYLVSKIKRISIGPVKLGGLRPGEYRPLTPGEIFSLKSVEKVRMTKFE